jgi:uncharacterized membrane protein
MTGTENTSARLDRVLARLLSYGTWTASTIIAVGLALSFFGDGRFDVPLVTVGVAVLVMLPVLRVLTMAFAFLRERDYHFAAVAALVLAIMVCAFAVGAADR